MQNVRLSGLVVLLIENAEAWKVDVSKIPDDFVSRKTPQRRPRPKQIVVCSSNAN